MIAPLTELHNNKQYIYVINTTDECHLLHLTMLTPCMSISALYSFLQTTSSVAEVARLGNKAAVLQTDIHKHTHTHFI